LQLRCQAVDVFNESNKPIVKQGFRRDLNGFAEKPSPIISYLNEVLIPNSYTDVALVTGDKQVRRIAKAQVST
jgi:hypothetical protein